MRLTTHLDWVQLMQMKAQGRAFNAVQFKSRMQEIIPKKDLHGFLKRLNQKYESGTSQQVQQQQQQQRGKQPQQVQQQLSQVNFGSLILIQPALEASIPFAIEAPIRVSLRDLLLCCGSQPSRIKAPCVTVAPGPAPLLNPPAHFWLPPLTAAAAGS